MNALLLVLMLGQSPMTSTGRTLAPMGKMIDTGGFPVNVELSPDRRLAAVLHSGTEHNLTILDARSGKVLSKRNFDGPEPGSERKDGLYFGLRFAAGPGGALRLYCAHGAGDRISAFRLSERGELSAEVETYRSPRPMLGNLMPHFLAGIAVSSDGKRIFAVGNQSFALSDFKGTLSTFDFGNPNPTKVVQLPSFPLEAVLLTRGPDQDRKLYVSSERDAVVAVVDTESLQVTKQIAVGDMPTHMTLDAKQERLYVSCARSDLVSVIDTRTDRVIDTLMVRPPEQRGLPGANPLGLSLSPDGKQLFVALSDLNAIAAIDVKSGKLNGMLPTGWYPTDVVSGPRGLIASVGKGSKPVQPNLPPAGATRDEVIQGDSGPNIRKNLQGQVAMIGIPKDWSNATRAVLRTNLMLGRRPLENPPPAGIRHVIYIVKENRTYDQLFGDLPEGNGRPDLVLYGKNVTPNQRALAERFVLLDNFYCCAEMSADGWSWSTAGITSPYVQRNAQYEYSGRKREYDYEGQNNGTPADARGQRNVNDPPGGYLWDNALRHRIEFRNYGVYIAQGVPIRDSKGQPIAEDNSITMRAFRGRFDPDFRMYDLDYAESDAYDEHGITYPKRRETFGKPGYRSRIQAWRADYARLLKENAVPPLMLIRFGNDHTAGTTPGSPSPAAMIADNDYAVGQLVETVSNGPLWKSTAIVIVEDDAQGGYDHVDGHRSVCFVVSPFVQRRLVDKRFYNTDSALRTVEWLLGMAPANQFMATARPIQCFENAGLNDEPFRAIRPGKDVFRINTEASYRAADSARLFHTYREESAPDRELADILWGDAKGAKAPRPKIRP